MRGAWFFGLGDLFRELCDVATAKELHDLWMTCRIYANKRPHSARAQGAGKGKTKGKGAGKGKKKGTGTGIGKGTWPLAGTQKGKLKGTRKGTGKSTWPGRADD